MRKAVAASLLAGALAVLGACQTVYTLDVRNVQGPTVRVVVNGDDFGELRCRAGSIRLLAGVNAPPLPWRVDLVLPSGDVFRSAEIDGRHGPTQEMVLLEVGVIEVPPADPITVSNFENLPCPDP